MNRTPLALTCASAAAAVLASGCASGSVDERSAARTADADAILAAYELTGESRSCLNLRSIDEIEPLDDSRWLITMRNGDAYLNEVSRGCRQATSNFTYLQYETSAGSLCINEIVRVIDRGSNTFAGACGLGEHQALAPAGGAD